MFDAFLKYKLKKYVFKRLEEQLEETWETLSCF